MLLRLFPVQETPDFEPIPETGFFLETIRYQLWLQKIGIFEEFCLQFHFLPKHEHILKVATKCRMTC